MPGRFVSVIMITGVSPTKCRGTTIGRPLCPAAPQQSIFALKRQLFSPTFSTLAIS